MGAVTSIMYGDKDPSIAGMVLDSPFSSLKTLVEELVKDKINLPNFIVNQALSLVKSTVYKKAKFKLEEIEPITYGKRCFIPALFVAAKNDNFVKPHHSQILHDAYPGDKNLVKIVGDHNSVRPRFFKDSAAIFFYNTLQVQFIKEISDNYAGYIYSVKKEDDNSIEVKGVESDLKLNNIVEFSSDLNNALYNNEANIENLQSLPNLQNLSLDNPKKIDQKVLDKMNYDVIEDEEELFNKILEFSKNEYEHNQSKKEEENLSSEILAKNSNKKLIEINKEIIKENEENLENNK